MKENNVYNFWNSNSCGEELFLKSIDKIGYDEQMKERYDLEPYILDFANFRSVSSKKVLEIGVGLGSDHQMFAQNNCDLYGVDLTKRAIEHTQRRLELNNLESNLQVLSAETLPFSDNFFDLIYSWGVIHHAENPEIILCEISRVLKTNGSIKIMLYNKYSFVTLMLWFRYGLLKMRFFSGISRIVAERLESPGTKCYSKRQVVRLLSDFKNIKITTKLSHGDLLSDHVGQKHKGNFLSIAKLFWPRSIIKKIFPNFGLFLLIEAKKK